MANNGDPTEGGVLQAFRETMPAYDVDRGEHARAGHLDLQLKGGTRVALAYAHLLWLMSVPGREIIMHFSTHTVHLRGRRLHAMYEKLLRHEVQSVAVVDERYDVDDDEDEPVVTAIELMQKPGPDSGVPDFGPPTGPASEDEASGEQ